MPGRLYLTHDQTALAAATGVPWKSGVAIPAIELSPGGQVPLLVAGSDGAPTMRDMRWSMIMGGRRNARGRPVMETIVNARSETVLDKSAFDGVRRGAIVASGWYEWTGKARRKTRWRLARRDGAPLVIAAIWDRWSGPGGVTLDQCAAVTCDPNADVAPYHRRMPVLLSGDRIMDWLGGDEAHARSALQVPPSGLIQVGEAADIKSIIGH